MAKQKSGITEKQVAQKPMPVSQAAPFVFTRQNFIVLFAGLMLLAFGFILMRGGSQPPTEWDTNVVYGFTRITLSTTFVLIGFAVITVSIFWKSKKS
ncbi:MAG: DUF3098 domain-containing protein [Chitinophagales bacterium]|nr:DUF3098 domain-containing protein [Chitinophagales bacterium]